MACYSDLACLAADLNDAVTLQVTWPRHAYKSLDGLVHIQGRGLWHRRDQAADGSFDIGKGALGQDAIGIDGADGLVVRGHAIPEELGVHLLAHDDGLVDGLQPVHGRGAAGVLEVQVGEPVDLLDERILSRTDHCAPKAGMRNARSIFL